MTTPESPDTAIQSLEQRIRNLESTARLSSLCDAIADLDALNAKLVQWVKDIRAHGYVYEKNLESQAESLTQSWSNLSPSIHQAIDQNSASLEQSARTLQDQMNVILSFSNDAPTKLNQLQQLVPAVTTLESQASAAESEIRNRFDAFSTQINSLSDHLKHIDWMLAQIGEASFHLQANESIIGAVPAVWNRDGNDDPQGTLFLTDQRVIFEQKQDVATKKFLFITTEKQRVQKVLFAIPLTQVKQALGVKRGLFDHEDYIDLSFDSSAPVHATSMHIDGQEAAQWQSMIGRAQTHDYDADRAIAPDAGLQEKLSNIPSTCPKCGGKIDQTIERGQTSLTCSYCGNVIRF